MHDKNHRISQKALELADEMRRGAETHAKDCDDETCNLLIKALRECAELIKQKVQMACQGQEIEIEGMGPCS